MWIPFLIIILVIIIACICMNFAKLSNNERSVGYTLFIIFAVLITMLFSYEIVYKRIAKQILLNQPLDITARYIDMPDGTRQIEYINRSHPK